MNRPASWVIKCRETGRVLMEIWDPRKVAALNTAKYQAVPIVEHLAGLTPSHATAYNPPAGTPPAATPPGTTAQEPAMLNPSTIPRLLGLPPENLSHGNT
jgi:hypothetical protein